MSTPTTSTRSSLKELTFRGIIIGGIITLLFTAANYGFLPITPSKKTTSSKRLHLLQELFPQ